ncbi:hypothetical protein [Pseudomonas fulva]|uniref:hypothetical protein n=1 Tax=Pseudomonas fulva TaxID=47880 RepID=UPI003F93822D
MEKGFVDRAKKKAFHKLLVDRIGEEAWAKLKAAYLARIREKEAVIDLAMPIEPQLFEPPENDIDWYILAAELSFDTPLSDSAYSSRRVYPYVMAIGAYADELREVPGVNDVLDKMLANNGKPETQIFELLTAAFYLRNGYNVAFIPENSILWPNGKTRRSPDMLISDHDVEFYVECKRADKQTGYSQDEERAWDGIWSVRSLGRS